MEYLFFGGFFLAYPLVCVLGFILWIYAIVQTIKSNATDGNKVLWVLFMFFLPFLGVLFWLFLGPRASRTISA